VEPIEFLRILRRRWRVLIACALIGVVAAFVVTPGTGSANTARSGGKHRYTAKAVLLANVVKHSSQMTLSQDALLLTIGVVPRRSAKELAFTGNPARLVEQIHTAIDLKVGSITVTSTQATTTRAVAVVNTFSEQLVKYLSDVAKANFNLQVVGALALETRLEKQLAPINKALDTNPKDPVLLARQKGVQTSFNTVAKRYSSLLNQGVGPPRYRLIEATSAISTANKGFSVTKFGSRPTRALFRPSRPHQGRRRRRVRPPGRLRDPGALVWHPPPP
jgi:hypothetical protein